MRNLALFILIIGICPLQVQSQTLWTGPLITFSKADSADWTLEENQDRISDSVWITRQHKQGFFNIRLESAYNRMTRISPLGTEWANGRIADGVETLSFTTWTGNITNAATEEVGVEKVVHLIAEDIYIDIKLTSWTGGGGGSGTGMGGGFAYERSTPATNSLEDQIMARQIRLLSFPERVEIISPEPVRSIRVLTVAGQLVLSQESQFGGNETHFPLNQLQPGLYVVLVNERYARKFVRE